MIRNNLYFHRYTFNSYAFFLWIDDYLETIFLLENRIFLTISGIANLLWIDESNKWLPVKAIRETG